jgi:hypothetical protein
MIVAVMRNLTHSRQLVRLLIGLAMLYPALAAASPFGINAHIPNDAVADRIVEAGIEWVRIDFVWSTAEPERDVYDWRAYDALLDRLEARGLKAYATLQGTPAWATSGPEFSGVPDDPGQWQEFVYLAAARYRGRIAAWGIWNEPNSDRFWRGSRSEYIQKLLIPASIAVRTADPEALVAGPDLAHLSSLHWDEWLREVIADAGNHLDVITHHYYPSYGTAWELLYHFDRKPNRPWRTPSVRDLLIDAGWWGRPFWLTETGVESAVDGPGGQADYYERVIDDWFGDHPEARWIDRVFFYQMNDPPAPPSSTWGIVGSKPELVAKPAFFAYQRVIPETAIDEAVVLEMQSPGFVLPGQRAEIVVSFRNDGTNPWTGSTGYHLDVAVDTDEWLLDADSIEQITEIQPGGTARFTIRVEAPWDVGTAGRSATVIEARMVADDERRFGEAARTVLAATNEAPPKIIVQPKTAPLMRGQRVVLTVDVISDSPLGYRWRRNSVLLSDDDRVQGSSTANLRLGLPDASLGGDYDCVVTNDAGAVVTESVSVEAVPLVPRSPDARRGRASESAGRPLTQPAF